MTPERKAKLQRVAQRLYDDIYWHCYRELLIYGEVRHDFGESPDVDEIDLPVPEATECSKRWWAK